MPHAFARPADTCPRRAVLSCSTLSMFNHCARVSSLPLLGTLVFVVLGCSSGTSANVDGRGGAGGTTTGGASGAPGAGGVSASGAGGAVAGAVGSAGATPGGAAGAPSAGGAGAGMAGSAGMPGSSVAGAAGTATAGASGGTGTGTDCGALPLCDTFEDTAVGSPAKSSLWTLVPSAASGSATVDSIGAHGSGHSLKVVSPDRRFLRNTSVIGTLGAVVHVRFLPASRLHARGWTRSPDRHAPDDGGSI